MSAALLGVDHIIWEGRFQPFHLGHLAYVQQLASYGPHVWVWVLANELSSPSERTLTPDFTREVDQHHKADKNPYPLWLRLMCVQAAVGEVLGPDRVTVSAGRRLDLAWDFYKAILPPNRAFITPRRDSFEDSKARAWSALGERCIRVDPETDLTASGTAVRAAEVKDHLVPPTVQHLLSRYSE